MTVKPDAELVKRSVEVGLGVGGPLLIVLLTLVLCYVRERRKVKEALDRSEGLRAQYAALGLGKDWSTVYGHTGAAPVEIDSERLPQEMEGVFHVEMAVNRESTPI